MVKKSDVNKVFRLFRKEGFFAKQNFWCCQSCGWGDVPEEAENVVFYHNQDNDSWEDGILKEKLYLAWRGNGNKVVEIIESVGLKTKWDGKEDQRIAIVP